MAFEDPVLKYNQAVYENSISVAQNYLNKLDGHISTLEGYEDQLFQYWDDDKAQRWYQVIEEALEGVNSIRREFVGRIDLYNRVIGQIEQQATLTETAANDAYNHLESISGIVGAVIGAAAKA